MISQQVCREIPNRGGFVQWTAMAFNAESLLQALPMLFTNNRTITTSLD